MIKLGFEACGDPATALALNYVFEFELFWGGEVGDQFFIINALDLIRQRPYVFEAKNFREDKGHLILLRFLAMHFKGEDHRIGTELEGHVIDS